LREKQNRNGEEDDDLKKNKGGDERPRFNLRWSELLFDPDPDNVVAVGLTGVLAWASVQVLWQLFVISFAILIAAVKYSFIAALLIFFLITLL
jgi:ABC-type multidrug transport system fused ATPase/permease subunit